MDSLRLKLTFAVALCIVLAFARQACPAPGKIRVAVSVPPQAFFAERIGGHNVEVQVLLPGRSDHDAYHPTPQQMMRLSRAQVYVKVGVPGFTFESRHIDPLIGKRDIRVINMSDGIKVIDDDPHIWVSPAAVRQAARNICRGLAGIDPGNGAVYNKNLDSFLAEIDSLDREIRSMLKGREGGTFLIYHPSLGYFADHYGLKQVSIETEGKSPSASHIRRTIELARAKGIRTILVQKGFDLKSAAVVATEIGGKVEEIDPLERDWLDGTRKTAKAVARAARK